MLQLGKIISGLILVTLYIQSDMAGCAYTYQSLLPFDKVFPRNNKQNFVNHFRKTINFVVVCILPKFWGVYFKTNGFV